MDQIDHVHQRVTVHGSGKQAGFGRGQSANSQAPSLFAEKKTLLKLRNATSCEAMPQATRYPTVVHMWCSIVLPVHRLVRAGQLPLQGALGQAPDYRR